MKTNKILIFTTIAQVLGLVAILWIAETRVGKLKTERAALATELSAIRRTADSLERRCIANDYAFYTMTKSRMQYLPAQYCLLGCYDGLSTLAAENYPDSTLRNFKKRKNTR